jgi:hypothetical protein
MTQPQADPAPLPLALTYTPDASMASAVRALVARVAQSHGGGDPSSFGLAMDALLAWLLDHADGVQGSVALTLDCHDDTLLGDVRWQAAQVPPALPDVATDDPALAVACNVAGSGVHCRVSRACS